MLMMDKWSDDSACCVVHNVWLYSVLDTVVIYLDDVRCSVVFVNTGLCLVLFCYLLFLLCFIASWT